MDEVGELAQSAPYPLVGFTVADDQADSVPPRRDGISDQLREGEGLSRGDENPIDAGGRQGKVVGLALLQLGIDLPQCSPDQRVVAVDESGQWFW